MAESTSRLSTRAMGFFKDYFADSLAALEEHVTDRPVDIYDEALVLLPQGHLMMRSVAMAMAMAMAMALDAYLDGKQKGRFSRTV
jgi:oxygen-independent coproporphyrinogen-3 oxidase